MEVAPPAHWLADLALTYASIGALFGLVFLAFGIERVDPASRGAYAFRPLLLPGIVLLWPLVAWRWVVTARRVGGEPRR
jgi:hypothetical protein